MSEDLKQLQDSRVLKLEDDIARLKAGKAVVCGGKSDVKYIRKQIEEVRAEDPSLAQELDDLLAELETVDPTLSTYEARKARSPYVGVDRRDLEAFGLLDAVPKKALIITKEAAQKIVDERKLKNGIYAFENETGEEVYIVVQGGKVGLRYDPTRFDLKYLVDGHVNLQYIGVVQV